MNGTLSNATAIFAPAACGVVAVDFAFRAVFAQPFDRVLPPVGDEVVAALVVAGVGLALRGEGSVVRHVWV